MKKNEVLKQKGIKLRKATEKDKKSAKSDFQREADYVIQTNNGDEYYSKNGSLKDCLSADSMSKINSKAISKKTKITKNAPSTNKAKKANKVNRAKTKK